MTLLFNKNPYSKPDDMKNNKRTTACKSRNLISDTFNGGEILNRLFFQL